MKALDKRKFEGQEEESESQERNKKQKRETVATSLVDLNKDVLEVILCHATPLTAWNVCYLLLCYSHLVFSCLHHTTFLLDEYFPTAFSPIPLLN